MFRVGDRVITNKESITSVCDWSNIKGIVVQITKERWVTVKLEHPPREFIQTKQAVFSHHELDLLNETPFLKNLREYIQAELNTE